MTDQLTRHQTADGELFLGELIHAADGLDRSWVESSPCRLWAGSLRPTPWQVHKDQRFVEHRDGKKVVMRGDEMIKMALMICATCPVQYDCAAYAVEGLMQAGTWSMGIANLRWLQGQEGALDLVAEARELAVAVDEFVTALRRDVTMPT